MKKFLLSLFLWPALCFGQGAHRINQVIIKGNGISANISPGSKVLVCVVNTGCTTLATIYLDSALTSPTRNPVTADGSGNYDYYIASGCVDEQISSPGQGSIFVPNICPFNGQGGGGSGNVLPTPQFRLFIQPNPGTNAVAGPATASVNAVAPQLQGAFNTDLFTTGSGNNGLLNLEAGSCSTGKCTPMFPATSTSFESAFPTVSQTHVQDFRGGGQADFYYNPINSGAGGYVPSGARISAAHVQAANFDQEMLVNNTQAQQGTSEFYNFNSPSWNFGSIPLASGTISSWATQKARSYTMNVFDQGIGQVSGAMFNKFANGDSAIDYSYNRSDGGFVDPSGEGTDGHGIQVLQNSTWFHGTAAAGATLGTQNLPTTFVAGSTSRTQFSVGGFMLDFSHGILSNAHVTGISVQMPNNGPWAFPIDATVTESTAWGRATADIPAPTDPGQSYSTTINFTVDGGVTNTGAPSTGYVVGKAWMDGAQLQEQAMITAVGPVISQVQSVTFTHSFPNAQAGTFLFQGGTNGFYMPALISSGSTYSGWEPVYTIFGATDSTHLVGRFSAGGTNNAIPSFFNVGTANVALQNLSVSGTTVTATCFSCNTAIFNGLATAVISNASNTAFNGTVANVKAINNTQIQWTQTVTGTSATAQISYAPLYFAFSLFNGARVMQPPLPSTPTVVPLEPNDANWTPGTQLQNVFNPSFRGALLTGNMVVNSPDSQQQNGIVGINQHFAGNGISGQFAYISETNGNSNAIYQGGGGALIPTTAMSVIGPVGKVLSVQTAPIDRSYVITVGCAAAGCNDTNDVHVISMGNGVGQINYLPVKNQFFVSGLATGKIEASFLSTGDGHYVNGNIAGGIPVALTSAGSAPGNSFTALGIYGAFGNGITPLDTSATMAAAAYYAGTVYAGALPPTGIGVTPTNPGSSTYSYVAVSNTQNGHSVASASITTNIGNATLSSFPNGVDFTPGPGAQSTDIYRTAAPGGYSLGRICSNIPNASLGGGGVSPCVDSGQAATGTAPVTDTSGTLQSATGTFTTSLTVGGQNVCQANGTNCPVAAAGTLTGTTLNSTVVNSSLTSVGTLGSLTVTGTAAAGVVTSGNGFTGTCAPTTTITVSHGIITGCS